MSAKPQTRLRVELQLHGEWSKHGTTIPRRFDEHTQARRFVCAQLRFIVAKLEGDGAAMDAANVQMALHDPLTDATLRERLRAEVMAPAHAAWDSYAANIVERFCAKAEVAP